MFFRNKPIPQHLLDRIAERIDKKCCIINGQKQIAISKLRVVVGYTKSYKDKVFFLNRREQAKTIDALQKNNIVRKVNQQTFIFNK